MSEVKSVSGGSLAGVQFDLALAADELGISVEPSLLKNDFDVLVKAGLAYVVQWLRKDWIPIMTEAFGGIGSVGEGPGLNLGERITPAIRDEFLHCAQLLQGLEVALLQLAHLETVSKESFLSLQNLLVHLRDRAGDDIPIADTDHGGSNIFCSHK